jgi:hypothetical protein
VPQGSATYHQGMDRQTATRRVRRWAFGVCGMLVAVVGLAACSPAAAPRSKGPVAQEWAAVLHRLHEIQSLRAVLSVSRRQGGATTEAEAVVEASGSAFRESITSQGTTLWEVDDGTTTWLYPSGSTHYAVAPAPAATGFDLRWATVQLPMLLAHVRVVHWAVGPHGDWRVTWTGTLPGLGSAQGLLVYDPRRGVPERLTIVQGAVSVDIQVHRFVVNPALSPSTFRFVPPAGASSLAAAAPALQALDQLTSALNFPVLVPDVRSGLTLTQVSAAASSRYGAVVMLALSGSAGPLLLTEYQDNGGASPPSSPAAYSVAVGSLTVTVTDLPVNGIYATVVDGGTAIVAEGPDGEVMQALANLPAPPHVPHQLG